LLTLKAKASFFILTDFVNNVLDYRGRRGGDRMVVGFTTTYAAISAYHH
jgi:hypothetical protein